MINSRFELTEKPMKEEKLASSQLLILWCKLIAIKKKKKKKKVETWIWRREWKERAIRNRERERETNKRELKKREKKNPLRLRGGLSVAKWPPSPRILLQIRRVQVVSVGPINPYLLKRMVPCVVLHTDEVI